MSMETYPFADVHRKLNWKLLLAVGFCVVVAVAGLALAINSWTHTVSWNIPPVSKPDFTVYDVNGTEILTGQSEPLVTASPTNFNYTIVNTGNLPITVTVTGSLPEEGTVTWTAHPWGPIAVGENMTVTLTLADLDGVGSYSFTFALAP